MSNAREISDLVTTLNIDTVEFFKMNEQTIDRDVTIPTGLNAVSAGNVAIANTATVTVSANSRWVVV